MAAVKVSIQVEQIKLRGLAASNTASLHTADALLVRSHHEDEPIIMSLAGEVGGEVGISLICVGDKYSLKENIRSLRCK